MMKLPNRFMPEAAYEVFIKAKEELLLSKEVPQQDIKEIMKKYRKILFYDYCTE